MKSIHIILKNIRNLFPYFLLIAIYFFFVNLEARKSKNNNIYIDREKKLVDTNASSDSQQLIIKIPVIPYEK